MAHTVVVEGTNETLTVGVHSMTAEDLAGTQQVQWTGTEISMAAHQTTMEAGDRAQMVVAGALADVEHQ